MPVRSRITVFLLVGFALALPDYAAAIVPEKPRNFASAGLLETSWSDMVRLFEQGVAKIAPPDDPVTEPPTGNGDGDRGATLDPWG